VATGTGALKFFLNRILIC